MGSISLFPSRMRLFLRQMDCLSIVSFRHRKVAREWEKPSKRRQKRTEQTHIGMSVSETEAAQEDKKKFSLRNKKKHFYKQITLLGWIEKRTGARVVEMCGGFGFECIDWNSAVLVGCVYFHIMIIVVAVQLSRLTIRITSSCFSRALVGAVCDMCVCMRLWMCSTHLSEIKRESEPKIILKKTTKKRVRAPGTAGVIILISSAGNRQVNRSCLRSRKKKPARRKKNELNLSKISECKKSNPFN